MYVKANFTVGDSRVAARLREIGIDTARLGRVSINIPAEYAGEFSYTPGCPEFEGRLEMASVLPDYQAAIQKLAVYAVSESDPAYARRVIEEDLRREVRRLIG